MTSVAAPDETAGAAAVARERVEHKDQKTRKDGSEQMIGALIKVLLPPPFLIFPTFLSSLLRVPPLDS